MIPPMYTLNHFPWMFIPCLSLYFHTPPPSHHTHYKSLSLTPNPYHNKNAYRFAKKRKFASLFWFFVLFLRNNLQIPEKNQFWERWAREAPLISCFFLFFLYLQFSSFYFVNNVWLCLKGGKELVCKPIQGKKRFSKKIYFF